MSGERAVVWHDVECGGYDADLELWADLAGAAGGGPILDLGCGTGRVALHLARLGFEVKGLDREPDLIAAFNDRTGSLPASGEVGDARSLDLGDRFGLAIAPMQLLQLFEKPAERVACLSCVAAHLSPGGKAALAIAEQVLGGVNNAAAEVIPDTREIDGWVYSSLPLETNVAGDRIVVRRLRQTVSPDGDLSDETNEVRLQVCSADLLENEAEEAGLRPAGRQPIPPTEDHVGSTVVVLEAAI
jgi:SAM-dependent methyltransferase